jgi:hypothetical protein
MYQTEQGHGDVEERPAPDGHVNPSDQPGRGLHRAADQDRVLHLVPGVGHLPLRQAFGLVKRVDVGVTEVLELPVVVVPGARAARDLLGEREHHPEHGRGDEHAGAAEGQRERRAPPPRPDRFLVIVGRDGARPDVIHTHI